MAEAPSFWVPGKIGELAAPNIARAREEGLAAGLRSHASDKVKRILVGIDYQRDFVNDGGTLQVKGALADVARFIDYIYANAEEISAILLTLDQHIPWQIFYCVWWKYVDDGRHPAPFTMITESKDGNPDTASGYVFDAKGNPQYQGELVPLLEKQWSLDYNRKLKATGQTPLFIWPEHCMIGTPGAALVPELSEAIHWLGVARGIQPVFVFKGTVPESEHYGPFCPCVQVPGHPQGGLQTKMLDVIGKYDVIDWSGEAEDFCVREGTGQFLKYFGKRPDVLKKVRFLRDCTSLVFPHKKDEAEQILEGYRKQHVHIVKSTDALAA